MSYLKSSNSKIYGGLAGKSVGSSVFNRSWKELARRYPQEFNQVQHDFIKRSHYTPVVNKVANGIGLNVNNRSSALQNVVWSMGVQHGSGGAYNIFKAAGISSGMSDRTIIQRLYNERMKVSKYFSRSSSAIRNGVYNRFKNELRDALNML